MARLFAPGCALAIYKPGLVERLHAYLRGAYGDVELLSTCCRHTPRAAEGNAVINVCPGCDRRYRENYAEPATVSLWEALAGREDFPFPDHCGARMSIIDACPTRSQARVHDAVRALARRMNIEIVEPAFTRERSTCCGDIHYGSMPKDEVLVRMREKAASMPADDVLVYCVSCAKAMFNGGKRPRYLVDLLFAEDTVPGTCDPDAWHAEIDAFISTHDDSEKKRWG